VLKSSTKLSNDDKVKLFYFSGAALLISSSYSILRQFKISIFFNFVGKEYYPYTKLLFLLLSIPTIAIYSKIVDRYKKETVLYICFSFYSVATVLFALLLTNPSYGISNSTTSVGRMLGWFFTITMEFFSVFVMGLLWAFINSVSSTNFAKNCYGTIYAFVKIGTVAAAGISFFVTKSFIATEVSIPALIASTSVMITASIFLIRRLTKKVSASGLLGYHSQAKTKKSDRSGILSGLKKVVSTPYVFGIFLLFYFYEILFTIIEYQTTVLISEKYNNALKQVSSMLFLSATAAQVLGILFVFFVTPLFLRSIPMKYTLSIMPVLAIVILIGVSIAPSLETLFISLTMLPAVHYSINSPAREMLFIPTSKEIQFKSKLWIDSFGKSISKSSGSSVNLLIHYMPKLSHVYALILLPLTVVWTAISLSMGKTYQENVDQKRIIEGK